LTSLFTVKSTFILRELNEVASQGMRILVYSLRPLTDADRMTTSSLPYNVRACTRGRLIALSAIWFALQRWNVLLGVFMILVKENYRRPRVLAKAMCSLWLACCIANDLKSSRLHVSHIHAHWATIPTTTAWVLARLLSIEFSFTGHAWDLHFDNQMLPFKVAAARSVLTCSDYNRRFLTRLTPAHAAKIHRVYHGLPLTKFPYRRFDRTTGIPRILAIGRYVEQKGFIYLLRALKRLDGVTPLECRIYGDDGIAKTNLARYVEEQGLSHVVQLHGFIDELNIVRELETADVFVMPSVVERSGATDGIPNVIIEALAVGVPTIATNVAGIPELIRDRETGLLVPEKDDQAIANAILTILGDPHLRRWISKSGRELVERDFNVVTNAAQHLNLIS
jgi:glycosyltransferase involved in cell wall biosynthesis